MARTLLQSINALNWFDHIDTLKSILRKLLIQSTPKYKVLTATLSISGTTPSLVELDNTLGTVAITREDEGVFLITSDGLFTEGKTWLNISNRDYTYYSEMGINDSNELFISVKQRGDDSASDSIEGISIKIEVYN